MDDDVYAYEQELNEMDEWEAMHAHEMEAADEAMLAMEVAYTHKAQATHSDADTHKRYNSDADMLEPTSATPTDAESAIDAKLARAQERLQKVLDRCATLMGEDDEDDADAQATERDDVDVDTRTRQLHSVVTPAAPSKSAAQAALDSTTASFLHSRPPVDVDSLPVVLHGGKRVFLRKKKTKSADAETTGVQTMAKSLSLAPIQELMASIERRQIEAAMAKTDAPLEDLSVLRPPSPQHANVLWLDKYKPKRFIDLLSDERTNREVLLWVKKWDRFVFPDKKGPDLNHTSSSGYSQAPGAARDRLSGFGASGASGSFKPRSFGAESGEKANNEADDPRPLQKLILICGPPGAGKTTLANIVACHAGYNPIEVNASDDRTASILKNKIISAMEMQSIFGARKPNCIILDEIDGAMNSGDGRTAIAAIQEIVSAPLPPKKSASTTTNGKVKRTSGGGASHHPLTRPLICICNDQYASVLRPLRKLAKIFVLDTPHAQRLVSRLKFICKAEGLPASTGALSTLAASGDNDIRYCLNALQFHSTQSRATTSSSAIAIANGLVGRKDHASGVYDTMDKVFYQPKARSAAQPAAASSASASSALSLSSFAEIEDATLSMGNTPLLLNALDENLPKMVFNDPTMRKLCDALEWLGVADAWDTKVRAEQQFAFLAYVPFAALAVHRACCTSSRRRVEYPRAHFAAQVRAEKATNILQAFVENSQLHASLRVSAGVLAVDVVPWLVAILSPNIRRLNVALQSADEKAMVQRLIELMAALGLSFRPKYLPDGSEDYALEPALHELLEFRGGESDAASYAMLPLAVKKMITREVELQQMRRSEGATSSSAKTSDATPNRKPAPLDGAATATFTLPELSDDKLAAKLDAIRKRNPFAFAHREAKRKRDASEKQSAEELKDDGSGDTRASVRYKFNEGYTCGIITTVYMRDLL